MRSNVIANTARPGLARAWVLWLVAAIVAGALPPAATPALAQAAPNVRYDALAKIVYVGANYNPADPAEAPYVGYPSHPDAPKQPITVPALDAALAAIGQPDLLVDQGAGAWLLRSDVVISPTARLEATSATIAALRLDSTPNRFPALTRLIATGGHLLFQGISITSWDNQAGAVDAEYLDGRSFLLAQTGGRMDIIDSDVSYLGWADGEPSGLSWRKRATAADPKTGATGSIIRSNIHHNYFGQYSYEAYGIKALNSEFHHNVYYGFDPHDFSFNFEVAYNKVYNNGKHGIIFSRGCEWNWIHSNEVYNNAEHGIMLDRGTNNNKISNNLVYNNRDGVAIFQSSNNLIQDNVLRDNERGVRINATYDANDIYDGLSIDNTVLENTIQNNSQYGIYLYERGDKNKIVRNVIEGSGASGIYVRSGSNTIEGNSIRDNAHGVTIIGGAYTTPPPGGPAYVAPVSEPGHKNSLFANAIDDNAGAGVQVRGGVDTLIGPRNPAQSPGQGNQIRTNGSSGIILSEGTVESLIQANTIHANSRDGVQVRGATTAENRISRNSIAANGERGISLRDGSQGGIASPVITSAADATTVTGTALAGATVEVYRDTNGQGNVFLGSTLVAGNGSWSFPLPAGDNPNNGAITALVISSQGNTSAFASNAPVTAKATYTIGAGRNGELTVFIGGPGSSLTLPDIAAALQVISPTVTLLENQGGGVWQANASLFLTRGVTLTVAAPAVTWLKLRSQGEDIVLAAEGEGTAYNYDSFTTLRTHSGALLLNGVKVTSWDPAANTYDLDVKNGRGYLLAKYDARMDIVNSELSYLGSADGESYGVSWRDINDSEAPDVLQTRVTGQVLNSVFSHNYFGIYTYQASNMVFRGNKFHNNIGYGFDPHDYSNNFLVENNEAFENGNHGFIISRGCTNFTFRNNKSYNNRYAMDDADRNAHGFMLDPGSPNSAYPQVPSTNNLLENNQAWGNDGYGLRILGSNNNTVRGNTFRDNLQGVTLERGSTGNVVEGNTITGNDLSGIFLFGGADGNTLKGNTITGNALHGIYIKTGGNAITGNTITGNGTKGADGPKGSGVAFLPDTAASALSGLLLPGESALAAAADPELRSDIGLATAVSGNQVKDNTIAGNAEDGLDLKGATGSTVTGNQIKSNGVHGVILSGYNGQGATANTLSGNAIMGNGGHGIRASGAETLENAWSQNSVSANQSGGIRTFSGANNALTPPSITEQTATRVAGTAAPGARVEIFSDDGGQGLFYEGQTTAKADGSFSFTRSGGWRGTTLNATATDADGNSSGFAVDRAAVRVYLPLVRR